MQSITYVVSIGLHSLLLVAILLLPTKVMIKHERPMEISITAGVIGGQRLPLPVLGQKKQEVIQPSAIHQEATLTQSNPSAVSIAQQKPMEKGNSQPELKPQTIPQHIETLNKAVQPADVVEPKIKPVLQKEVIKKETNVSLKKETKNTKSNAVLNALASFKKEPRTGGGDGHGTGGGGLNDVYAGMVMMAIQPNWSMPTYTRDNIVALVRVQVDPQGNVLSCHIERSSGRPDFDASAVNAVVRTKVLPPPPTLEQQEIVISFNALELSEY